MRIWTHPVRIRQLEPGPMCSLRMRIWLSAGDWQVAHGARRGDVMQVLAVHQVDPFRGWITRPSGRSTASFGRV